MAKPTRITLETESLRSLVDHIIDVLDLVEAEGPTFTLYVENARDIDSDKDAKSLKAYISRELIRAQSISELLGAELGVRIGQMKGSEDPRKVTPDELA